MAESGRPSITEDEYRSWLETMRPFLQNSNSLYYAIEQAGLVQHKSIIFQKYNLNDWFMENVDRYRATPGELVNDAIVSLIRNIIAKIKRMEMLTSEETKILTFYAEKAKVAQDFFVSKNEVVINKDPEKVLDDLINKNDNVDDVAAEIKKQMGENQQPIQNQEQGGENSSIPA